MTESAGAQKIMKKFPKIDYKQNIFLVVIAIVVVVAGVSSGWFLAGSPSSGTTSSPSKTKIPGSTVTSGEEGISDDKTFRDDATGKLESGGISGEGTHHLVRDGGPSQNVYLTSTVIDLEGFVGKEVQVWGETISAKKAGWLMDVGKVKVVK